MSRYLIVNADDLGISKGVNRGIVEAHVKGIVTSTTIMINQPDAEDGIRLVQRYAPNLGMGLHITLTHGRPVMPSQQVASLVRSDGRFYGRSQFSGVSTLFRAQDLRAEILAQFDRFIALTGHLPDHIDSHHYAAYLHPVAYEIILDLVAEHQLPLRSARNYMNEEVMKRVFLTRGFNKTIVDALSQAIVRVYESHPHPLRWPDRTERRFYHEGATLENLCGLLRQLPAGVTELMCHPGYTAGLDDSYCQPRETELAALTHPAARQVIEEQGIQLITFAEVPEQAPRQ